MKTYQLELFADYFQFYFQDDNSDYGDLSEAWTEDATKQLIAISDRVVGVGTVRDTEVQVYVKIDNQLPELDSSQWDKINRAEIYIETGRIVFAGCTDYFPDATRIEVTPGIYDVVIGYKDLYSVSADGLEGNDSYHIYLARSSNTKSND